MKQAVLVPAVSMNFCVWVAEDVLNESGSAVARGTKNGVDDHGVTWDALNLVCRVAM